MRAVLVSVDYTDLLALTLPANRHHFGAVTVVTSPADAPNVSPVARAHGADVFATDAFYRHGATFNKWLALEEALDAVGRHGWLCLMDADVLWPKVLPGRLMVPDSTGALYAWQTAGTLVTPVRRMMTDVVGLTPETVPPESEWGRLPVHPNLAEWAGYTQVFHASDPRLGSAPWHEVNWRHAGGADSFFQQKWPPSHKVRPPWEVLHLGPAGMNWCGRASRYTDGTAHPEAALRAGSVRRAVRGRRPGPGRFDAEKLPPS